jgi:hypothetical protein
LIWDFDVDVLLSTTATPLPPKYPPDDDENSGICPLLDITRTTCSCSNFPLIGKVLIDLADFAVPETQTPNNFSQDLNDEFDETLEQRLLNIHVSDIDEQDAYLEQNDEQDLELNHLEQNEEQVLELNNDLQQDEEQENNDAEQFAELIFLKGVTFHGNFQETLHACKQ